MQPDRMRHDHDRAAKTIQRSKCRRLEQPVDGASLAAFRIMFGGLLFISTIRFVSNGWVERFYEQPTFFFRYWGFTWISVASPGAILAAHYVMAALSLAVAFGIFYRAAAVAFFLVFTYVELIDVTNYLNHYYLVSLVAFLLCFLPAHRVWSIDAARKRVRTHRVPRWCVWLLRFQFGAVYAFAALAKIEPDWLLHGQPLGIWFQSRTETPLVGPLLTHGTVALWASWAGFLHDALVVPMLLWKPTRVWGFLFLLFFHLGTHAFFTIGIFPFLMPIGATLFFEPEWPRRWIQRLGRSATTEPLLGVSPEEARAEEARIAPAAFATMTKIVLAAWCAAQVLIPLRSHLYGGSVLWHEQGMRYAWRVMLREKNGSITYRVRLPGRTRERLVSPRRYLTHHQAREMSGQPDLILQLAHHIAEDFREEGRPKPQVRVDAWVSLNGRPAARLIDPEVNLTAVKDGLAPATWILPMPKTPPLALRGAS